MPITARKLSWRAWKALQNHQHPTHIPSTVRRHLWAFYQSCIQWDNLFFCGLMLATPHHSNSRVLLIHPYSIPKSPPPGSATQLCQVLPTHLLKDHFCSKKLPLKVLTLLQRQQTEAQGFLQQPRLRNYEQISHLTSMSLPLNHRHLSAQQGTSLQLPGEHNTSSFWLPLHKDS